MTEQEIVAIIRTLKAYYPYYYKGITAEEAKAVVNVWKFNFGEFDNELIERAVHNWGSRHTTPPTIADLKNAIFALYSELDSEYSKLIAEKADKKLIEKVGKQRAQAWKCKTIVAK